MKRLLVLTIMPALLSAADLRVDHATVCGSGLQNLQARLKAVGIEAVYGGAHTNHATEMALVSFPDGSYLELMGIQQHADAAAVEHQAWAKQLRGDAGPCAWAVQSEDTAADAARLKQAGIPVGTPVPGGRQRPDGAHLEWQTADIGSGTRGAFFPFLIQDFTPRAQRAFPQGKPVTRGFEGIRNVVIAVRNLDSAVKLYRQAFGLPQPLRQTDKEFGAQLASFGAAPVILAQPLTADTWLAQRIERFGEGPCALVLKRARGPQSRTLAASSWFGVGIGWFDRDALGWRLGVTRD